MLSINPGTMIPHLLSILLAAALFLPTKINACPGTGSAFVPAPALKEAEKLQTVSHETSGQLDDRAAVSANLESGAWPPDEVLILENGYGLPVLYTTDGSEPGPGSARFESPIALKDIPRNTALTDHDGETSVLDNHIHEYAGTVGARVIRAAVLMPDGSVGPETIKTYFLTDDLWERFGCALISVITDPGNLYDYEYGILVRGRLYDEYLAGGGQPPLHEWEGNGNYSMKGPDWERPAYVQMFDGANRPAWESACGMRVKGKASRTFAQRSFNIYFREDYGQKRLSYELIPGNLSTNGKSIRTYKSFSLRNGGNDTMGLKFRDVLIQDLFSDMHFSTQRSRPAVVYLNGEYYGIFSLMEKYSGRYVKEHYGVDPGNVVMIEDNALDEGLDSDYDLFTELMSVYGGQNADLTVPETWEEFSRAVDVQSMADYFAAEIYIANVDWNEYKNCRLWRSLTDDGTRYGDARWRWMMFDTEYSTGQYLFSPAEDQWYPPDSTSAFHNSFEDALESCPVFGKAMLNPEFRTLFAESMHRIAEVYMEPSRAVGKLEEYYTLWSRWYPDFAARFGADPEAVRQEYEVVKDFLLTRPQFILPVVDEYCGYAG